MLDCGKCHGWPSLFSDTKKDGQEENLKNYYVQQTRRMHTWACLELNLKGAL